MSNKLREAAKAALMTLAHLDHLNYAQEEIFNLQEALAEEPAIKESLKREWVGLTGDEIEDINKDQTLWEIIRAAEAKLREKNT
jgi:hypothetical protein